MMNIITNQENDLEFPVAPPIILPHSYSIPNMMKTPPTRRSFTIMENTLSPFYKSDFNASNSCLTLTFGSYSDLVGQENLQVYYFVFIMLLRMI